MVLTFGCRVSEVVVSKGIDWRGVTSKGLSSYSSKLNLDADEDVGLEGEIV